MPFTPNLTPSQSRRLRQTKVVEMLHIILLIVTGLMLLACAIADKTFLGQLAVCIFAIIGLALQLEADKVFKLALVTFILMPIIGYIQPDSDTPENMAVFSFLLLIVGVGLSLLELFRTKSSRKPRS